MKTVKQFYLQYGECSILKGIEFSRSITLLSVRKQDNRIFVEDDRGDCGLDDSDVSIIRMVNRWIRSVLSEIPEDQELWFHPGLK